MVETQVDRIENLLKLNLMLYVHKDLTGSAGDKAALIARVRTYQMAPQGTP